ncbi:glycosyltransferase [Kaistia adipata]|uniref:glycosyltransferase n=1 Tax=Kaistia adipata TaxID=166954 RepID=UPI00048F6BD9|nr:glycosyltransferase [Kaistia adipata]
MIPPVLHQICPVGAPPEIRDSATRSWMEHNPGWTHKLWTERDLLSFLDGAYPGFLRTYCGLGRPEMRRGAVRYFLLDHFGGVFADHGSACVAPFDPILAETRVVLCRDRAGGDGAPASIFSGTMAGPAGHPFWRHAQRRLTGAEGAVAALHDFEGGFLDETVAQFADPAGVVVHDASLFASSADDAGAAAVRLSVRPPFRTVRRRRLQGVLNGLRRRYYLTRHHLTRGPTVPEAAQRARVDRAAVQRPASTGDALVILVPMRDAAEHIEPFLEAIARLDYPRHRIKLAFCEGDSQDGSWQRIQAAAERLRPHYRDVVLTQKHIRLEIDRSARALPGLQRRRRSALARVRNHLIDSAVDETDDWALWVDIDVWRFAPDIVSRLRATGHRIVVPNCVIVPGGRSFDLNSFVACHRDDYRYYRAMRDGLHQPRLDGPDRLYLSDFTHCDAVALDAVGGTMLLVDAALHRGGLRFPEMPYENLVETEGFGALARDVGVRPVGLPRLEIQHVPW